MDAAGELCVVRGCDWNVELGSISELNYLKGAPKALLFDDVKGYPAGRRVLTGAISNPRRLALAFGLGEASSSSHVATALHGRPANWERVARETGPEWVTGGPVTENVFDGGLCDLTRFPAPFWHVHDGGRYLGTGTSVITSDPDTGRVNAGAYRVMLLPDGRCTVLIVPGKHGRLNCERWWAAAGRCPLVISLGHHPVLFAVSGTEVPQDVSELAYAGAILGEPLPVLKGELTGLPVPAYAEIAIEGWIRPDLTHREGPFGEWTGHYTGNDDPQPVVQVGRVYHRNDPILLGTPPGKPPHDFSYTRTALKSAMIRDALVQAGLPEVGHVWAHECGGGRQFLAVSIRQRYPGHARQAGFLTSQLPAAAYMGKYVVVVDEDIDVTNLQDVIWAMCFRCDPAADIDFIRKAWASDADPMSVDPVETYNSRAVIDACIPFGRRASFPRVARSDAADLSAVENTWAWIWEHAKSEGGRKGRD